MSLMQMLGQMPTPGGPVIVHDPTAIVASTLRKLLLNIVAVIDVHLLVSVAFARRMLMHFASDQTGMIPRVAQHLGQGRGGSHSCPVA